MTIGTFDVPHIGHMKFLEKASKFAGAYPSEFFIGVNTDRFVESFKGAKPLYSTRERMAMINGLGYRRVVENDGPGIDLIRRHAPETLIVGSDWLVRGGYLNQIGVTEDDLRKWNLNIVFVPYTAGISTTDIKRRISES